LKNTAWRSTFSSFASSAGHLVAVNMTHINESKAATELFAHINSPIIGGRLESIRKKVGRCAKAAI
jgi:hypothetical protein